MVKNFTMSHFRRLETKLFPQKEELDYVLHTFGAKGSLRIVTERLPAGVKINCQLLASLQFPPKKLVDNEMTAVLENESDNELKLVNYTDKDYKMESRRTLELKRHGIETRFVKFEEERGYVDYPAEAQVSEIADPLSVIYLARQPDFLKSMTPISVRFLVRSGVLNLKIKPIEEKNSYSSIFSQERGQVRVVFESEDQNLLKGPYFSKDLKIWLDKETGVVTEVSYPFLGNLGKATLLLEKRTVQSD